MLYFSYGSNLSTARMRERVPSAEVIGVATLFRFRLCFHKVGMDGSAKCDILRTGNKSDKVLGILYEIAESDKPILDRKEDLGSGYREISLKVVTSSGDCVEALTYLATRTNPELKPFGWYREHILRGVDEHGLPGWYRQQIERVPFIPDADQDRHLRELSIYP